MSLIEEINEKFGSFCINLTKNLLTKCEELCREHHVSPEDLADGWWAFSSQHKGTALTETALETMVRSKLSGKGKARADPAENSIIKIYTKDTIDQAPLGDLPPGSSPLSGQTKRQTTPSQATPKRGPASAVPRSAIFSPTSYSPIAAGSSERYESRTSRGDVVSRWGADVADWAAAGDLTLGQVTLLGPQPLRESYRYMFERMKDRTDVLNARILQLGEQLQRQHGLEDYQQPHSIAQEPVCVAGRIACDGSGRLNSKSIQLEGGKGDYGQGKHVELDVSRLQDVGLFTGQVVAARGVNPTGRKFVASEIWTSVPPPALEPASLSQGVTLLAACGPFTTAGDLQFTPLQDLLQEVKRLSPHLVILTGPFIDAKVVENDLAETYHELWNKLLDFIKTAIEGSHTRVLLVPSTSDLHAEPVLPTPPFAAAKGPFTMLPNPACVSVDGLAIGVTSTDVLMHLSQQDIKLPGSGSSDRLARLAGYLLDQQSFYPLYPPDESVGLDFQHWRRHCQLPVRPHVLVTPSDFKGFVKEVGGCLVVNPSRLSRGQVGGTYARIRTPSADQGLTPDKFSAQVLKI